eukprot:CAMPEP_0169208308 /NCGR_PEP_ID=MMETSP1016-20121227/14062_1 /TAXON_ID=342587 /ORGANISM="Karlodinium micrum, Strain CCMP2283" /LENGTH=614 /DNA_ID=CAMNT_0009285673 /DNA_START=1610 /DNA_END=3458 /DNA_ORIENTATION=-
MEKEAEMGQGTSSICRKGVNIKTQDAVAIKVYKESKSSSSSKQEDVMMLKFKRQVEVLTELQKAFQKPTDPSLWHDDATAKPSSLFMALLDYSKIDAETPGADPTDGVVYVVTELAQYSLKDYLALRREQCRPIPKDSVKSISRAIVLVVAGLHAKGLVHIDLKPENLMMFNGRLKLIDVDGCVKIGTTVSIQDSSISFSPCYCAPEWAQFLINESNSKITVVPALDVWSVGMTICELVTLNALLKPMYGNFLRNAHSHKEAGFLFMDWLSSIKKVPLPKNVEKYDPEFVELINDWLLVCDKSKRKSCAESLSNKYIQSGAKKSNSSKQEEASISMDAQEVKRAQRIRPEDDSNAAPLHKGQLWKLNSNSDPKEAKNWLQRDIWLMQQGTLTYFSSKENKRLVLVDASRLSEATVTEFKGGCKEFAFQIKYTGDNEKEEKLVLATATKDEYDDWVKRVSGSVRMEIPTMKLGAHVEEMRKFVVTVKNRRQKVEQDQKDQFAPVFKAMLWKLKAEGDKLDKDQWFEREMWISKNGSLVYYSQKEERDLVYYTTTDLMKATYSTVPASETCKPFTFLVHLADANDVAFAPGEFAANSAEERDTWLAELKKVAEQKK